MHIISKFHNRFNQKIILSIFFIFFYFQITNSIENKIEFKINNEIISSIDINNEKKLLLALNPRLVELNQKEILEISIESVIREKIKKIEIKNYKKEMEIDREQLTKLIESNYKKINFTTEKEFQKFLNARGLTLEKFEKKLIIEALWNELIFLKYRNKVNIDEKKLREEIVQFSKQNFDYSYNLSEIVFSANSSSKLKEKNDEIQKEIQSKGFENAASISSISSTASIGGKLGWIDAAQLSEKIRMQVLKLKVGENTQALVIPGGFLILKLNDLKKNIKEINIDDELKKLIRLKTNEQLNQYSNIYFNKIKKI